MTSQTALTTVLPPANPTLDLGLPTGSYTASGFTRFAQNATISSDGTVKIQGLQVRIETPNNPASLSFVDASGALDADGNGTIGNITFSYNNTTKLLRLSDNTGAGQTATAADFQTALRSVAISGATGAVKISANLGRPVYRSENGNYYDFVTEGDFATEGGQLTTWTQANTKASASTFLGLQGYLATITSQTENDFLSSTFDSRGWIGGQVTAANQGTRTWTWTGGPDAGKSFWIGGANGASTGAQINYANWDTAEPNNFVVASDPRGANGESYAQFTAGGKWNDLADDPSYQSVGQGLYRPNGYWVEYGLGDSSAGLSGTRDSINLTVGNGNVTTPLDLVFYDPIKGQASFAFTGSTFSNITTEGADTPALTRNSTGATPEFGSVWKIISANVDVDKDGVKDIIFANRTDNAVAILFGEARTGTDRQFAYRNSAFATINGTPLVPGLSWTIDFASNKLGANNEAGIFWRSTAGETAIWSFTTTTVNGATSVAVVNSGVIASVGANSGWRAVGDGEFNQDAATREVFWVNDTNGSVATWSLGANRTTRTSQFAWGDNKVPTSTWDVVGIGKVAGTGVNDNIVWQQKGGAVMVNWTMLNGSRTTPPAGSAEVITLTATDRIKAVVDVDGDGVLDLVGQFDGNGTIGAYALTAGFTLKNTAAPRTQYSSNNPTGYRPAKGGLNASNLELVNVAQYNA